MSNCLLPKLLTINSVRYYLKKYKLAIIFEYKMQRCEEQVSLTLHDFRNKKYLNMMNQFVKNFKFYFRVKTTASINVNDLKYKLLYLINLVFANT